MTLITRLSWGIHLAVGFVIFNPILSASASSCEQIPETPADVISYITKISNHMKDRTNERRHSFSVKIRGKVLRLIYRSYSVPAANSSAENSPIHTTEKGTVIFLCGGPGHPCSLSGRPTEIPKDYDVITMDYLGIGDNVRYKEPELMAINSQGRAVAQLANILKAKRLVIYGQSFGTTVATVAASIISDDREQLQKSNIKGVLLDGVAGKGNYQGYEDRFYRAAQTTWELLTEEEKQNFQIAYRTIKKTLSPELAPSLDYRLTLELMSGSIVAVELLRKIAKNQSGFGVSWEEYLESFRKGRVFGTTGAALNQIRAAACQIFNPKKDAPPVKIFGDTVTLSSPIPFDVCECKTVSTTWDPNKYQIRGLPVLYINGQQDPNSAFTWAKSHFEGQKSASDRLILTTTYGGHSLLSEPRESSGLRECTGLIFESLFTQDLYRLRSHQDSTLENSCP